MVWQRTNWLHGDSSRIEQLIPGSSEHTIPGRTAQLIMILPHLKMLTAQFKFEKGARLSWNMQQV